MPLKIAGAGISGLCAAITAAQHNEVNIEVRDKAKSVQVKKQRGINALRNYSSISDCLQEYQSLGFNLKDFHPIYKQIYYIDTERYVEIESKAKPIFYTTSRGIKRSIDHMLLQQAESLDVKVTWSSTFSQSDIIATGPKYRHCIGYGKHFLDVEKTDTITILQNSDYSPFGYACILPYNNNEATVVLGTFNPKNQISLKKSFQKIINKIPHFQNYISNATESYEVKGVGNFGLPETAIMKSSLLAGERAGFLEAFRGFGIHNAIISGYAAGLSYVNGENYDNLWKKMLSKDLQRGLLRRIAENEQNLGSERILMRLLNSLPKQVTIERFREELKKIEKELFKEIDITLISKSIGEWNKLYPFNTESDSIKPANDSNL